MCFYFQTTCSDIFSCRRNQQPSRCSVCLSRCRIFCWLLVASFIFLFLLWFCSWVFSIFSIFSWNKQTLWSQNDPQTYFFACPDPTLVTIAWNNQHLNILDPQNLSPLTWTWSFVYPLAPWSRLTNYLLFLSAKLTKSYATQTQWNPPFMECVYTLGPNAPFGGRPLGENFTLLSVLSPDLYPQFSPIPYWICLSRLQSCFKIQYDYSLTSSFLEDQKTNSMEVAFNPMDATTLLEKQVKELLRQSEVLPSCFLEKEGNGCEKSVSGTKKTGEEKETKNESSLEVTVCENLNVKACIFSLSPRSF